MGIADLWYENIENPQSGTLRTNRISGSVDYPITNACIVDLNFRELEGFGLTGEPSAFGVHIPVVELGSDVTIRPGDQWESAEEDGRDYTYQIRDARRTSFRSRWELVVVRERTDQDNYD